ncbi:hypothetical protein Lesp02_02250 [Lentzea sp. NBRC 105346]|uniref:hypothetical protein n=1 Tax=Lentzea sp. NBRC 105346 TaxID=3032205 RepID=UPI0024A52247|nr:hypothetical protein [Lentzea sp. NBRC 105346]GLZ28035.1 hypothetical protein Lesp02_02250 [Lentzea sp. NBRC 105346]
MDQFSRTGVRLRGIGLAKAETQLTRLQDAIKAGVDPAALVEAINEAQAVRAAARAELEGTPAPNTITDADIYAMIDGLGDVGAKLAEAKDESLAALYEDLDLHVRFTHTSREADVSINLAARVNSANVRGGT